MRKLLVALTGAFLGLCLSASWLAAQDFKAERDRLREQHKTERKAMKMKHGYTNQTIHSQDMPKAQRQIIKHQMDREKRELRERQKDDLQDLKDRQKALRESQERY